MSHKDSIENMRAIAKQRGGRCLSDEYFDQKTPLKWQCAQGHVWLATPTTVKGSRNKSGTWCRICGIRSASNKRKCTVADMQRMAEEHGGRFASPEYLGSQVKHQWECNHYPSHPSFGMIPNAVQQGQWCPKCRKNSKPTLIELNALANSKNSSARCLSTEYKNSESPLEWQCGVEGHPHFIRSYKGVRFDGAWCPKCREEKARPTKYCSEMLAKLARKLGGHLLSAEPYRSTKQPLQWRCADGHEFNRTLDSILSSSSFCPECGKRAGLREQCIRELFSHLFCAPFERTRSVSWLVNSRGNAMELDGYNKALAIAFEHNGLQHYQLDGFFTKHLHVLEQRLADDREKIRLCKANAVTLVVVPYSIPLNQIQTHVLRELERLSIKPPNTSPFSLGILAPSVLEKLRQHASRLGGCLVSDHYKGSGEKLFWRCKNLEHPPFQMTPNAAMNNGQWCRKCAAEHLSGLHRVSVEQIQQWAHACNGEMLWETTSKPILKKDFALTDKAEFVCNVCKKCQIRSIRQVKDGRLCLCHTKKVRIDVEAVKTKLANTFICLVEPTSISGGRSIIDVQCKKCGTRWRTKASHVINNSIGCPQCRPNSKINTRKAREHGEKIGFYLRNDDVNGGTQLLHWECNNCGHRIDKSYREMRNVRKCPSCVQIAIAEKLKISL